MSTCRSLVLHVVFSITMVTDGYRMASWHINNFGTKKMEDPMTIGVIVDVMSRYDLVFIQGIKDNSERDMSDLRQMLNQKFDSKVRYGLRESLKVGQTNETREQYAIFFRKDTNADIEETMVYDKGDGAFERAPYVARVKSKKFEGLSEFAVISIHVNSEKVIEELNHLPRVVDLVMKKWGIGDVMIVGDMGADCEYISGNEWIKVTLSSDPSYLWLIDDDADTAVGKENCAYDRIIVRGAKLAAAIKTDSAKAFNFKRPHGLKTSSGLKVSHHFPVEVQIQMKDDKKTTEAKAKTSSGDHLRHQEKDQSQPVREKEKMADVKMSDKDYFIGKESDRAQEGVLKGETFMKQFDDKFLKEQEEIRKEMKSGGGNSCGASDESSASKERSVEAEFVEEVSAEEAEKLAKEWSNMHPDLNEEESAQQEQEVAKRVEDQEASDKKADAPAKEEL